MKAVIHVEPEFEVQDPGLIERIAMDVSRELYDDPSYYQFLYDVRRRGHRVDHRVIRGDTVNGVVLLHLQLRDGGSTVGG